ncbi:MAG TPA: CHAT domain-containing protein [Leptolyngbyaceae cyanobacterium M33_DOE_097]|uniref:CHAT domain-containing protein n=1 Tax=Oscillatoriales cyanobacterium SpSt-418 TaxID=2282169 RepID=A0A7C3PKI4_9CYAN|nr:CHAT domain-containing protein [Leptolyngbyaceae cyanobacterium M33_DOE_097]
MEKLVVLSFGNGDVVNGFASVRAQLWDADRAYPIQVTGGLPGAPELPSLYRQWQLLYLALHHRLGIPSRIKIKAADVTNVSEMEFNQFCQRLSDQINYWLSSAAFRPIDQQLRTWLNASDEVRIIIETNDSYLRQLPWHLWHFFAAYPHAEVALSLLNYQRSRKSSPIKHTAKKARILAILGDSQDIDVHRDRSYLEQLSTQAEIHFLVEPKREELNHQLWQGWDLLFFAGHSTTQETGFLRINPMENLSLEQLRWALNHAIANGLKLAIFNSCDGLGLAQSLADLQIPQVIVMREPVPDVVAQAFLKHFLAAFVSGRSLYTSVREARERLQRMEGTYPCASWLPVICQNPAEVPIRWEEWGAAGREKERGQDRTAEEKQARDTQPATHSTSQNSKPKVHNLKSKIFPVLLSSVMVTTLVMGMRYVGGLQAWELQAFDQLMRSRPEEPQDSRLLIVTITEDDFQLPEQQQRQGSLSDLALAN